MFDSPVFKRSAVFPQICAVEDSHLCPSLRFYIHKLKQRQNEVPDEDSEDQGVGAVAIVPPHLSLAARRTDGRVKWPRDNLAQYHDLASSALEVQISLDKLKDEDPFFDVDEHSLVRLCPFNTNML